MTPRTATQIDNLNFASIDYWKGVENKDSKLKEDATQDMAQSYFGSNGIYTLDLVQKKFLILIALIAEINQLIGEGNKIGFWKKVKIGLNYAPRLIFCFTDWMEEKNNKEVKQSL